MNVLITSAGRRSSLVRGFQQAVAATGGSVFTADVDGLAAAHFIGDGALRVPPVKDPAFIPTLLSHVDRHNIGLLVPTIDTELRVLAESKAKFADAGCFVSISDPKLIKITSDKVLTAKAFRDAGFRTPATWLPDELPPDLPPKLVCKPRAGSASEGVSFCSPDRLPTLLAAGEDMLVQEMAEGQEITADALLDGSGNPLHCVPRYRLRTIGGESVQGLTRPPDEAGEWLERLLAFIGSVGGIGPITVQAILTKPEPTLIEVNPRFGGGFPLALAAGARYPEWLIRIASGQKVETRMFDYEPGLYMTRSYSEEFTSEPKW